MLAERAASPIADLAANLSAVADMSSPLQEHSRHVTEPSERVGPRSSVTGYVAKGWVAAFSRNDTNLRQVSDDIA
ncbi:MAG: hypothetical protein QOG95_4128 [Mycobacterium sp.]|jgi:hypothetical protein|nr:hypothetical protein [Mycobacterium sp.]